MKLSSILIASSLLASPLVQATTPEVKDAARQVHQQQAASIYGIRGVIKINATMNGQPAGNQESEIWTNGLLVGERLFLASYRNLNPDFSAQKRPGLEIESEVSELKVVDASGEEFAAKLLLHDEDLGIAFIALDPSGEQFDSFEGQAVDISRDPELELLDEVVAIGRYNATLRYTTNLRIGDISGQLKRPRTKYIISGLGVGQPAFTTEGSFIGLTVPHGEGQAVVPVILPAKYIRQIQAQAEEKFKALQEG